MAQFAFIFCFVFLSALLIVEPKCDTSIKPIDRVPLVNHGYEDVVVALADGVPESAALLRNITIVLKQMSYSLYIATKNTTYVRSFKVLVPPSWKRNTSRYDMARVETFKDSPIQVSKEFSVPKADRLGVDRDCGCSGDHIEVPLILFRDFDLARKKWGDIGKVLVHEWAHVRWGTMDEYATGSDRFRVDNQGEKVVVAGCSIDCLRKGFARYMKDLKVDGVKVKKEDEALYSGSLIRRPDLLKWTVDYTDPACNVSLLHETRYEHVGQFCDKDSHDDKPNTPLNRFCKQKSAWEVISEHADYTHMHNVVHFVQPSVRWIQDQSGFCKYLLLLDRSGSMNDTWNGHQNRFQVLKDLIKQTIADLSTNNTILGIYSFGTNASRVFPIQRLRNADVAIRHVQAMRIVRVGDQGRTSPGAAIQLALNDWKRSQFKTEAPTIIILSDGKENESPFISGRNVQKLITDTKATTKAALFVWEDSSKYAGVMNEIKRSGKGNSYVFLKKDSRQGFEALNGLFDCEHNHVSIVKNDFDKVPSDGVKNFTFSLDPVASKHAEIRVLFDDSVILRRIRTRFFIIGEIFPPNIRPSKSSTHELSFIALNVPAGKYIMSVTNLDRRELNVNLKIISKSAGEIETMIKTSRTSVVQTLSSVETVNLQAQVTQKKNLVLDANLELIIERPKAETVFKPMLDDGKGADLHKNDGIYSAQFDDFTSNGDYTAKFKVTNRGLARIKKIGVFSAGVPPSQDEIDEVTSEYVDKNLERMSNAVSFNVQGIPRKEAAGGFYPPARITDFFATVTNQRLKQVRLTFTAVGGDLTKGRASKYILKKATTPSQLRESNFHRQTNVSSSQVLLGNLSAPKNSGVAELFVLNLFAEPVGSPLWFAIKAVDEYEREGNVSNAATVTFVQVRDGSWCSFGPWTCICETGRAIRRRRCSCPAAFGGNNCHGQSEEESTCQNPCGCSWTAWGSFSVCQGCGQTNPVQTRRRQCRCPGVAYDMNESLCSKGGLHSVDTRSCSYMCPGFCSWSSWSKCSSRCGQRQTVQRRRQCGCPPPNSLTPNSACTGPTAESKSCPVQPCRTWCSWRRSSQCSVSCGSAGKVRMNRVCECTTTFATSDQCQGGPAEKLVPCSSLPCPPKWCAWGSYDSCSVSCGMGVRKRSRQCACPFPALPMTSCTGAINQFETCNAGTCPQWCPWLSFGSCSATCGSFGVKKRKRICVRNSQDCSTSANGIYLKLCRGDSTEEMSCNRKPCPTWCPFKEWSDCSTSCGPGTKRRKRICVLNPANECDSGASSTASCDTGLTTEIKLCNNKPCANWCSWSQWSQCSTTCRWNQAAFSQRSRVCNCHLSVSDQVGCQGSGNEQVFCDVPVCPAHWTSWSWFDSCSATCGFGTRRMYRRCKCAYEGTPDSKCYCPGGDIKTLLCLLPFC